MHYERRQSYSGGSRCSHRSHTSRCDFFHLKCCYSCDYEIAKCHLLVLYVKIKRAESQEKLTELNIPREQTNEYNACWPALVVFSSLKETVKSAADGLPCQRHRICAGVRSVGCASLVGSSSSNNSQDSETKPDKPGRFHVTRQPVFHRRRQALFSLFTLLRTVISFP